jgi:hypothetical protein
MEEQTMRGILLIAAMSLALPACSVADTAAQVAGLPASPSVVCDKTTMDERGGQLVELGYKLFRTAGELAVDTGKLHGAAATRVRELDNQLFAATKAVQNAYATCNAASYKAAIQNANNVLTDAQAALASK